MGERVLRTSEVERRGGALSVQLLDGDKDGMRNRSAELTRTYRRVHNRNNQRRLRDKTSISMLSWGFQWVCGVHCLFSKCDVINSIWKLCFSLAERSPRKSTTSTVLLLWDLGTDVHEVSLGFPRQEALCVRSINSVVLPCVIIVTTYLPNKVHGLDQRPDINDIRDQRFNIRCQGSEMVDRKW